MWTDTHKNNTLLCWSTGKNGGPGKPSCVKVNWWISEYFI